MTVLQHIIDAESYNILKNDNPELIAVLSALMLRGNTDADQVARITLLLPKTSVARATIEGAARHVERAKNDESVDVSALHNDTLFGLLSLVLAEYDSPATPQQQALYDECFLRDAQRWFDVLVEFDPLDFHESVREFGIAEYIVVAVNLTAAPTHGQRQRGIIKLWDSCGVHNALQFDPVKGFIVASQPVVKYTATAAFYETGEIIQFPAFNLAQAYHRIKTHVQIDGENRHPDFIKITPFEES